MAREQTLSPYSAQPHPEAALEDSSATSPYELASLPLFAGEDPRVLAGFLNRCAVQTVPPGEALLDPASNQDMLYVLLSGRVSVRLEWDGQHAWTHLESGQCFGETSVIERSNPAAYVVSETPCRVLLVEGAALRLLLAQSHVVTRNLLHLLCSKLRRDNQMVVESLQQRNIYEQHSKVDPLTGLHNRRWLDEVLSRLVDRGAIDHQPLSLLMLDVDHFKPYNDTYGHLAGDRALVTVANTILAHVRPDDTAARYGGEEFIIVMPNTVAAEARQIAKRLCDAVRSTPVIDSDGVALPQLTVSIGLTTSHPDQGARSLLAAVDRALYRAKNGGRNRIAETHGPGA